MNEATSELSRDDLLARYGKARPTTTETKRRSPFKFLDSYDVEDADIFFGRDTEIEALLRRFHSYGHLLIYGESGSGKSSLVQCGLRARIPESDALFIPLRIHAAGLPVLGLQLCGHAIDVLGEFVEVPENATLVEALRAVGNVASRPLVLFFDQFEELVIFHNAETRQRFAAELAEIQTARINVKVIIGVRQDYLGHLSEFENTVKGLFDNRFWLQRMSHENASQAVVNACATCDVKIDRALSDSILQRLDPSGLGVELPYLQVAMDRLYRQAVEDNATDPRITADDVEKLGDIANILGTFLVEEVSKLPSPDTGRQILKAFVTREGTRRSLDRSAFAKEASGFGESISQDVLDSHLSQLASVRILREVADSGTFELRHDALAKTVAGWISEIEKELIDVRDNLINRFNEYQARDQDISALLDESFLGYLSMYRTRLKPLLSEDVYDFIEKSQYHQEQALRSRRRVTRIITATIGAVIFACLIVAVLEWRKAEAAQELAEAELRRSQQLLYVNNIGSAKRDWASNNVPSAWDHLNACPEELRGWEYYFLNSLFTRTHRTVTGHEESVLAIALAKDGFLASGDSAGVLRLGDPMSDVELKSIDTQGGRLRAVAISSDGLTIGTGSDDHQVRLWDSDGKLLRTLEGHTDVVSAIAFSPDGLHIASASHDKMIKLWLTESGALVRSIVAHEGGIESVTFHPSGDSIVSGGGDKLIKIWDVHSGDQRATLQGHTDYVSTVAFNQKGDRIVSASFDNTLRIWDAETNKELVTLTGHTDDIYGATFSGDGKLAFSAGHDKSIRMWDVETGEQLMLLKGHLGPVNALAVNLERGLILSGSDDKTIRIWDTSDRDETDAFDAKAGFLMVAAFNSDATRVVGGHFNNELKLWDIATGKSLTLAGHTNSVSAVVFTDDAIVSASRDQTVRRWDPVTDEQTYVIDLPDAIMGQETLTSKGHTSRIAAVAIFPNGNQIVTAGPQNTLVLYDIETGKRLTTFKGHTKLLSSVAFSVDAQKIVSGSVDHAVKVWDANSGECIRTMEGHTDLISSVDFCPDGKSVLSGSWDKSVRLWDVASGEIIRKFKGHSDLVYHVGFSPDGKRLASSGRDRALKLWDRQIAEPTIVLKGHNSGITTVTFSRDSKSLASGGYDGALILWQTDPISNWAR